MKTNKISSNQNFGAIKYKNMSHETIKRVLAKNYIMEERLAALTKLQEKNPVDIFVSEISGNKIMAEVGNVKFIANGKFSNVFDPLIEAVNYANTLLTK